MRNSKPALIPDVNQEPRKNRPADRNRRSWNRRFAHNPDLTHSLLRRLLEVQEGKDYIAFLARLCERELLDREQRAAERRIKAARFPVLKTLDSPASLDKIVLIEHGPTHGHLPLLTNIIRTLGVAENGLPVCAGVVRAQSSVNTANKTR